MTSLPTYWCQRCRSPLEPNADLQRPPWSTAEWIREFTLAQDGGALPPERFLETALLWDDEYLYAAYRSAPALVPVTKRENNSDLWKEHAVELFLAAEDTGYYEIEVNPLGAVLDLHFPHENADWIAARQWDAEGLRSAVSTTLFGNKEVWSTEFALPWVDMPALFRQDDEMRAQICRSGGRPDGTFELPAWGPVRFQFCESASMGRILLVP
ncbi:MAG: carbohydrate-binding family 9-like protein [Candidatus Latescibacterota bacterium]|nr:carbohydrate-binding family 9-like protein [Candidatus Latescibacterota bacterium]